MTQTYTSTTADLNEAELYHHLVAHPDGTCVACGQPEPCRQRLMISRKLAQTGHLPRRQPGVVGGKVFRFS